MKDKMNVTTTRSRSLFLLAVMLCCVARTSTAQISAPQRPYSFDAQHLRSLRNDIPSRKMAPVDARRLLEEDRKDEAQGGTPWRFGKDIDVDLHLYNAGQWETLPNGDRLWRLRIVCEGAYSINLIYREFFLPEGGMFHVYNPSGSRTLGAFTAANNRESRTFATGLIKGGECILEYYEPQAHKGRGAIRLSKVIHGYKDLFQKITRDFGDSDTCHNNVNCPEGADWQDEKRSVALILLSNNTALCSGALVNNTGGETVPYFLSANHCYKSDVENWIFMFNYESPACDPTLEGPTDRSILGCTVRARHAGSDFMLLELSTPPPVGYNAYYAGWSRADAPAESSVGIHHPRGDVKKISIDRDPPRSSEEGDSGLIFPGFHWRVSWDDGVTEGGSSGSPLFDQNQRVVGQLSVATLILFCDAPSNLSWYGKFSVSWDRGLSPHSRLMDWLDPGNTGVVVLDGAYRATTPAAPDQPDPPMLTVVASNSISLTWRVPDDNNAAVTDYVLQQKEGETGAFTNIYQGAAREYTATGLTEGSEYFYRVRAVNAEGTSPFSEALRVAAYDPLVMDGRAAGETGACDRVFLDPGGYGNYDDDLGIAQIIAPSSDAEKVQVTFTSFALEFFDPEFREGDLLSIYDGATTGAPLIGAFSGNELPPVITSTSPDGKLTFHLTSDESNVRSGWDARVTCAAPAVPDRPEALVFGSVLSHAVSLSWTPSHHNGSPITNYALEQKEGGSGEFGTIYEGTDPAYTSSGLTEGAEYFYRVRAVNGIGPSAFSEEAGIVAATSRLIMFNGETAGACGAVFFDPGHDGNYGDNEDITMTIAPSSDAEKVEVRFTFLNLERPSFDLLSIYDGATTDGRQFIGAFSGIGLPPAITSTSPDGKLTFRFTSDESVVRSGWEARVTCAAPAVPDRPEALVFGSVLSHAVSLSWTPPHHNGSPITNYVLEQKEGGSGTFGTIYQGTAPAYTSSGLAEGAEYFYRVRAVNGIGSSAFSEEAGIVAAVSRLVMFEGETAGACGAAFFDPGHDGNYGNNEDMTMTIAPSSSDAEKVEVRFTSFELGSGDGLSIHDGATTGAPLIGAFSGRDLPPVITSTDPEGKLTFRFISNGRGTLSGWEAGVICAAPAVPDRPEAPVLGSVLSDAISLSWTPSSNNGSPITNYVLEQKEGGSGEFSTIYEGTDLSYVSSGLREGTEYFYKLQAVNDIGSSAFSEEAGIVATATRLILFEGETTGACGAVFFDPGHDGDYGDNEDMTMTIAPSSLDTEKVEVTFTSFDLEFFDLLSIYDGATAGAPLIGVFSGPDLPPVITSTSPEGKLTFRFTSDFFRNQAGWEALVTCVVPVVPDRPEAPVFGSVLSHAVFLSWPPPHHNGSSIANYALEQKEGGSGEFSTIYEGPDPAYASSGLTEGTEYFYKVQAVNGIGPSAFSEETSVVAAASRLILFEGETTGACGATFFDPGHDGDYGDNEDIIMTIAPSSDAEKVQVTFTSFDLDPGYDFLSIYDGATTGAPLIGDFSGNELPPAITSASPDGKLTFRFTSDGSVVRPGWEARVTCAAPAAPDRPQAPVFAGSVLSNAVFLSWPLSNNNGSPITNYVLEQKEGGSGEFSTIYEGTDRAYASSGLTEGTEYFYKLRAVNGIGPSEFSEEANIVAAASRLILFEGETTGACGAVFFDPGHHGNYDNDEDITMTIAPSSDTEKVQVTFTFFDLRFGDGLSIHDGATTGAPRIGAFTGNDLPPVIASASPEGKLTFRFTSDALGARSGWGARVTCIPQVSDSDDPVITIAAGPSPVEEGVSAVFTLTRTGGDLSAALTVNVAVDDGADHFLPATGVPTMGVFMENMSTASLVIPTHNDDVDEANGTLTVTLSTGMGYTLGSAASASVTVTDNDEPEALSASIADRDGNIKLYPNPVGNILHIRRTDNNATYTVSIYALSGKRLLQRSLESVKNVASLNVSSLRSGVYLVQVTDSEGTSERYRLLKRNEP